MSLVQPILTSKDLENIFNPPLLSPEKITELRQDFSTAKEWREYVELTIPNADPQEQYEIKLEENRKRNRENCGFVYDQIVWDISHTIRLKYKMSFCKQTECPKCQERKKQKYLREFNNIILGSVVTIESEDEKKFKDTLASKDNYRRIPRSDGRVSFILEDGSGEPLTDQLKEELAQQAIELPNRQRITGNLGKTSSCAISQDDTVTETIEEAEDILANAFNVEIKKQKAKAIFNPNSTLSTPKQVETEVFKLLDKIEIEYNINMLQWIINKLQELFEQVCKDNNIIYKVLSIETVSINPFKFEWDTFKKQLSEA